MVIKYFVEKQINTTSIILSSSHQNALGFILKARVFKVLFLVLVKHTILRRQTIPIYEWNAILLILSSRLSEGIYGWESITFHQVNDIFNRIFLAILLLLIKLSSLGAWINFNSNESIYQTDDNLLCVASYLKIFFYMTELETKGEKIHFHIRGFYPGSISVGLKWGSTLWSCMLCGSQQITCFIADWMARRQVAST